MEGSSMDIRRIAGELNRRFAAELPEFHRRRLVFWHDEERAFENHLDEIFLEKASFLVMTGKNWFSVKKKLCDEDPDGNYVVYCPFPFEATEDNWLLNLELCYEVFRADRISLWLEEMGLSDSPELRHFIEKHKDFFEDGARRRAFAACFSAEGKKPSYIDAMLAVLCGTTDFRMTAILGAVLFDGADTEENEVYQRFVRYGVETAFWQRVELRSGFIVSGRISFRALCAYIWITALSGTPIAGYLGDRSERIAVQHQAWCRIFVAVWTAEDKKEIVRPVLIDVEEKINLSGRLSCVPTEALLDASGFPGFDYCLLERLMKAVAASSLQVDLISRAVSSRRVLAWYDEFSCFYEALSEVALMAEFHSENEKGFHFGEVSLLWKAYTADFYRVDTAYRMYHMAFAECLRSGYGALEDAAKAMTETVENLYVHGFLEPLSENWTALCQSDWETTGSVSGIEKQEDFYRRHVNVSASRMFVIVSDALRYEVGVSLAKALRSRTQCEVAVSAAQAVFPTVTKYGMAALLPHENLSISVNAQGKLQVLADGVDTSSTANREKILQKADPLNAAIQYGDLLSMRKAERQERLKGMHVVYIYHNRIDEAGHQSGSGVSDIFPACEKAIDEICDIVRIIRNELGGTRVVITADHGFLYTYRELTEDAKLDRVTESFEEAEAERRYLVTKKGADPSYVLPVKFFGKNYDAFAARGVMRMKKSGAGFNFVHGGVSLQELTVPIVEYHFLRNDAKEFKANREKYETRAAGLQLISFPNKLVNLDFMMNFRQTEPAGENYSPETYTVFFTDPAGFVVSDQVKIVADRTETDASARVFRVKFHLKPMHYDREVKYLLVIADSSGRPVERRGLSIDVVMPLR